MCHLDCEICNDYESTFEEVTTNHKPFCPSRLVPCSNECGVTTKFKDLLKHLAEDCWKLSTAPSALPAVRLGYLAKTCQLTSAIAWLFICHYRLLAIVKELIILCLIICASRSFWIILSDVCVCESELLCKYYCVSVKLCKS